MLNDQGGKLMENLENGDDTLILQQRLDDMNHRWNGLRSKSIAIRFVYYFRLAKSNGPNWVTGMCDRNQLSPWLIVFKLI